MSEPAQTSHARKSPIAPPWPGQAFTIMQFCVRQGICRATYYNLREKGLGPREMRILEQVRITPEAEADWRRSREAANQ